MAASMYNTDDPALMAALKKRKLGAAGNPTAMAAEPSGMAAAPYPPPTDQTRLRYAIAGDDPVMRAISRNAPASNPTSWASNPTTAASATSPAARYGEPLPKQMAPTAPTQSITAAPPGAGTGAGGPTRDWRTDQTDLRNRIDDSQQALIRAKYLAGNGNGPAVSPEQNAAAVHGIAALRTEGHYLERANQPSPTPLSPGANAANTRALDMTLSDQLMIQRAQHQPGSPEYNRLTDAMARTGQRSEGSVGAHAAGFLAGGMSPAVGDAYGQAEAGTAYAKGGMAATEGQQRAATLADRYSDAAYERYRELHGARAAGEEYDAGMTSAGRGADLAGAQANEQERRNRLLMAADPSTIGFLKQQRENEARAAAAQSRGNANVAGPVADAKADDAAFTAAGTNEAKMVNDTVTAMKPIHQAMSSLYQGAVHGHTITAGVEEPAQSLSTFDANVLSPLESSGASPAAKARVASKILSEMPPPRDGTDEYYVAPGPGIRSSERDAFVRRLSATRARLRALVAAGRA